MLFSKLFIVGFMLSASLTALADNKKDDSTPEVSIIQKRMFDKKHEVGLNFGHLPDDNFYEVFPISVNYIYHFNERYAWEVIRASYMLNSERDIKRDLEDNFGVTPSTFDELISHVETSFVIKPTYGKDSLWNKRIINHEGFITFGAGIATYEKKFSYGSPEQESALTISAGIGRKYFISKKLNVSMDLKDIFVFKQGGAENYVYLGLGLNYRFDAFGSNSSQTNSNNSIYEYLK